MSAPTLEQVIEYFQFDARECDGCPLSRLVQEEEGAMTQCLVIEGEFNCQPEGCPGLA